MDKLLTFFPLSKSVQVKDVRSLVMTVVIYVVVCAIMGIIQWALGWLPLVGWLLGIVGALVELYCVVGVVLAVLRFFSK